MKSGHQPFICLTGIDGCGKSRHIQHLKEKLFQDKQLSAEILSVWDITNLDRYHSHPFISDRMAIHRYLATISPPARALFILHALMESLVHLRQGKPRVILAEGYWYKYLFSELLHTRDRTASGKLEPGIVSDDAFFFRSVSGFPVPDTIILLDVSPEAVWERKPSVTPYECGFKPPSRETFIGFQTRLRTEILAHAAGQGWSRVNADRPWEEVAQDIWKLLHQSVFPNSPA
jgi:thymidylate kinase